MKRLHGIVRGRVQGVGFRASTQHEAARHGLAGWVRNLPDDSVEFVAEGDEAALQALLAWARRGPRSARVDSVSEDWSEAAGAFAGFSIRR